MKCLMEKGYAFTTTVEHEIVHGVKEKLCYVAIDNDEEMKKGNSPTDLAKDCELSYGNVIQADTARFKYPEVGHGAPFSSQLVYFDTVCT